MAFKLTTFDSLKIKGDILITTEGYLKDNNINYREYISYKYNDFTAYEFASEVLVYSVLLQCDDTIQNYQMLFKNIFKFAKGKELKTIVIPIEAFRSNENTFKSIYDGILFNINIFPKRSSYKVLLSIDKYLDFNYTRENKNIFTINIDNLNLSLLSEKEELLNKISNPYDTIMLSSVILNHYYNDLNKEKLIKNERNSINISIKELADIESDRSIKKLFAHIISPDQFKKLNNKNENHTKRFTKESLYRMALVLGLSFDALLQALNIEGYSFSPNDPLDIVIINYYKENKSIGEVEFIKYLRQNVLRTRELDIINRLEEIKNINGLIRRK